MGEIKEGQIYLWWNDKELIAELERRSEDLKSGKDKGFTKEESGARVLPDVSKTKSVFVVPTDDVFALSSWSVAKDLTKAER